MDSDDEAAVSSGDAPSSPASSAPLAASAVETLPQMLRLADQIRRRALRHVPGEGGEFSAAELVDVCTAAARVRYYDPSLFAETLGPALLHSLRQGLAVGNDDQEAQLLTLSGLVEALRALAALNAAGALSDFFAEAVMALRKRGAADVNAAQLRLLRDLYVSIGREADVALLDTLVPTQTVPVMPRVTGSTREGANGDGLPMRPGTRICESYLKTGACRVGGLCRFDHPDALRVTLNSEGYPMRPWAQPCPYFMSVGTCDYRKTCKWHHPDKRERKSGMVPQGHIWIPKRGLG